MVQPDPASSLGNPPPRFQRTVPVPATPRRRRTSVTWNVDANQPPVADLTRCRTILVVKLDFIGDWVLTTPFLSNLRRSAPDAEITVVVLDRVFELADACRFVDRVVAAEPAGNDVIRFGASRVDDLEAFLADYTRERFDLALVPRWDTDFNGALRIAAGSGAQQVVGFSERCTDHKTTWNKGDDAYYSAVILDRREVHEVEHNLALVDAIGGAVTDNDAILDIGAADWAAADAFTSAAFGPTGRALLAVAPFVTGRRQLPLDITASVTRRLARRYDLDAVVVGSPDHAVAAERFAAVIGGVSSAGALRPRQAAALVGRATMLLGMDSGPGHIAAALRTPVATVFSHPRGGRPDHVGAPERFAPWCDDDRLLVLQPEMPVAPCTDACEVDEPHCILTIDEAALWRRLDAFAVRHMETEPAVQAS